MANNPVTNGTHEDHVHAGEQSHKNSPGTKTGDEHASHPGQGGTHEQHVKAGEQSHKNSHA